MYISILVLPLLSFMMCSFLGSKMGEKGSKFLSCFLLLNALILSLMLFMDVVVKTSFNTLLLGNWFYLGYLNCDFSLQYDNMVCSMLILVLSVSFLVHLFSTSYMDGDPHLPSFMSYLSLFTFFMVILVTSGNLLQLFMGWEGVGLCSYLLMNFWYTSIQANKAAMKAMILNKMGDVSLLLAMMLVWKLFGSWNYSTIFSSFMNEENSNILSICNFLLLIGVMGKSAQMGLHTWLPDAMEGPTPVSALMHAATMVTAGVFLIISLSPLFEQTPSILVMVVLIGSLTAFFSSTMGLTQSDFKKVIAYSTCSQLGYMVLICGFSYYKLSLFHLINHGFFKALLFLSAGSIIHALLDEQDLSKAGGMINVTPFTYVCMLIGSLSLMGLPFLTGFYSKDLIMEMCYGSHVLSFGLWLAMMSASATAFYSLSLAHFTFTSDFQTNKKSTSKSHEGSWNLLLPLFVLVLMSITVGYSLQWTILEDQMPIILPNMVKFSALIVTMVGSLMAILLGMLVSSSLSLVKLKLFQVYYNFTNMAWCFDKVITFYITSPVLGFGFSMSYKLIDNQLLEKFGPTWLTSYTTSKGSSTSNYHSGFIYSYIFLFMTFVMCFVIQM